MPLTTNNPIAFIPTTNPSAARNFYETALGLNFVSDDNFALVFRVGPTQTMLRVVRTPQPFTPNQFTIFGWEITDIHAAIADLTTRGVEFLRIGFFEQDEAGVWTAPGGAQVAWFKDPDGQHPLPLHPPRLAPRTIRSPSAQDCQAPPHPKFPATPTNQTR